MTIAISIPVHEKQYVVINQIQNIRKYVPNSIIVIHISLDFTDSNILEDFIESEKRTYLNPERLPSCWGKIIDTHISNYKYIKSILEFDYFMFHASNDMYIMPGVEDYIADYDAGFHIHKIFKPSRWWPSVYALEDPVLKEIMNIIGTETIVATQVEGSYYKAQLFEEITTIIEKARAIVVQTKLPEYIEKYTREEVYFSTIAYQLLYEGLNRRIGYPTTYSEVHDFDRALWKKQHITWGIYHRLGLKAFIPRTAYDQFEKNYSERYAEKNPAALTIDTVSKLKKEQPVFLNKHSYLDDSVTRYRLYGEQIFSVKRVPRELDDPLRVYINNL